nr:thiolase family protein [Candidatus Sigynarchaeota archaeon]
MVLGKVDLSDVVICDYVRTGIGFKDGSLSGIRSDTMIVELLKALRDRNPGIKKNLESLAKEFRVDSILGCNSQIGTSALTMGRTAALSAHFPIEVPGFSLNRQCASGMTSLALGIGEILTGQFDVVFCGGVEQQTVYPIGADLDWVDRSGKARRDFPNPLIAQNPYIRDPFDPSKNGVMEGQIPGAEKIGHLYKATRETLDKFSLWSHEKAIKHADQRHEEIIPIKVPYIGTLEGKANETVESKTGVRASSKNGKLVLVKADNDFRAFEENKAKLGLSGTFEENLKYFEYKIDEGMRAKATLESMAAMKPIFRKVDLAGGQTAKGLLTAGNSCPENDGASAMLICKRDVAAQLGLKPLAHMVNITTVGSDVVLMLTGPQHATKAMMKRTGLKFDDLEIIELNEAFSTVVYAFCKDTGFDMFDPRLNPLGGAIAIGHPTGSTGCRLIGTIIRQLQKKNAKGKKGLGTLCVGLGMGIAGVVELE